MTALYVALATVGLVTGIILAAAVAAHVAAAWAAHERRRLERIFAPRVAELCAGLTDGLPAPRSRRDRALLTRAIVAAAPEVTGAAHRRLAGAFLELGLADDALAALRSRRLARRVAAAEALGELRLAGYSAAVAAGLRDPDPLMRAVCALAIARSGCAAGVLRELVAALDVGERASLGADVAEALLGSDDAALGALAERLRHEPDPRTAALVAVVLGERHAIPSAALLTRCLDDPDDELVASALAALGAIGDPSTVRAVVALTRGARSAPVRAAACRACGRLGDPGAADALAVALGAADWAVRAAAAEALVALGWSAIAVVAERLEERPPETVLQLWSALERAGTSGEIVERAAQADRTAQRLVALALASGARARLDEAAAGDGAAGRYARALLAGAATPGAAAA